MTKRSIKPINLAGIVPAAIEASAPLVEYINPAELLVDEAYQRSLSERSITLIRKIVSTWDWAKFKPPVCARTESGLEVIDGQHTAIAAASHPLIDVIPIVVNEGLTRAACAKAFVGQNRDRLGITATQMHFSALAAGDDMAVTIEQVCERAGVTMLKNPPANGSFKPGQTIAVIAIGALINRRGAMRAREVLEVLVGANCAPISSDGLKAVEALMFEEEYAGSVEPGDIGNTIMRMGPDAIREAKVFAAAHKVPVWRAMAVVLFRNSRKKRRAA